jgi:hypothetical protein
MPESFRTLLHQQILANAGDLNATAIALSRILNQPTSEIRRKINEEQAKESYAKS